VGTNDKKQQRVNEKKRVEKMVKEENSEKKD